MAPRTPTDSNQARALALVARYQEHGDIAARDRVIAAHLPLVAKMIQRYPGARKRVDDAESVGVLALMHALNKFDPAKSNSFGAYASLWVKAYLLDFLKRERPLVDRTRGGRKVWHGYGRAIAKLAKEGREATNEAIAAELGITPAALVHALGSMANTLSFDGPVPGASEDDGRELHDRLACPRALPDELFQAAQEEYVTSTSVHRALATLTPREREVIEARYLRSADESERPALRALGDAFDLSGERIRQIEMRAFEKLRTLLADRRNVG